MAKKTYQAPRMMGADPDSFDVSALEWLARTSANGTISAAWLATLSHAYDLLSGSSPYCLCDPDEISPPLEGSEVISSCGRCGWTR